MVITKGLLLSLRLLDLLVRIIIIVIPIAGCKAYTPILPITEAPTMPPRDLPTKMPMPSPMDKPTSITTLAPPAISGEYWNDEGSVLSHVWSPDGKMIALAGFRHVKIWEVEAEILVGTLEGHSSIIWGVSWSPDGSSLASASQDGTVRIWDMKTFRETAVLQTGWAFCVDWSPNSEFLAIGMESGVVQVWDVSTLKQVVSLGPQANSAIISVGWSPDGNMIAGGDWVGGIAFWEAESGTVLNTITDYTSTRSDVNGLTWSPDSSKLATAHQDGRVRIWNPRERQPLLVIEAHRGWVRGIAWSPDGKTLISSGLDKRAVLWNAISGQYLAEISHKFFPIWSVAWSPDGRYFTSGDGEYMGSKPGMVIRWIVK